MNITMLIYLWVTLPGTLMICFSQLRNVAILWQLDRRWSSFHVAPCGVELKVCQISIWSLHHVMVASYPEARLERMVGKKGCYQASFFGPKNQDGFETFELNTSDKHWTLRWSVLNWEKNAKTQPFPRNVAYTIMFSSRFCAASPENTKTWDDHEHPGFFGWSLVDPPRSRPITGRVESYGSRQGGIFDWWVRHRGVGWRTRWCVKKMKISRKLTYPTWRSWENHLQICLIRGIC